MPEELKLPPNPVAPPLKVTEQEQKDTALRFKGILEATLKTELEGFMLVAVTKDNRAQMISWVPADPGRCVQLARGSAAGIEKVLKG